jgi:hypothetical protein
LHAKPTGDGEVIAGTPLPPKLNQVQYFSKSNYFKAK